MKESFLERTRENLKIAHIAFDNGCYNASANRAYYAVFHAATAFLFNKNYSFKIDHKNVLSLFINDFINRKKLFPSMFKKMIYEMQDIRNDADYKSGVGKSTANKQLKYANEILKIIFLELKNEN